MRVTGILILFFASLYAHGASLEVSINVIQGSDWETKEIDSLVKHTFESYEKCGIHITFKTSEVLDTSNSYLSLPDFFSSKTHVEIVNNSKSHSSLNVYLTKRQDGILGPVEGRAIRDSNIYEESFISLSNTVRISRDPLLALSKKYKKDILDHILSHEIAHLLGLEHSYRRGDIMDNGGPKFGKSYPKNFRVNQCKILLSGLSRLKL